MKKPFGIAAFRYSASVIAVPCLPTWYPNAHYKNKIYFGIAQNMTGFARPCIEAWWQIHSYDPTGWAWSTVGSKNEHQGAMLTQD